MAGRVSKGPLYGLKNPSEYGGWRVTVCKNASIGTEGVLDQSS